MWSAVGRNVLPFIQSSSLLIHSFMHLSIPCFRMLRTSQNICTPQKADGGNVIHFVEYAACIFIYVSRLYSQLALHEEHITYTIKPRSAVTGSLYEYENTPALIPSAALKRDVLASFLSLSESIFATRHFSYIWYKGMYNYTLLDLYS
jgi:hypothetical protein